ncbi:hypothetical protein FBZ83_103274 [Azospirillum brasilense]|uniref:Uncharacterized protein n=1 Tax=Azospirillum brasilense TaxID=192 RepID=A0A560CLC3_AZOBR|nr:hypothetical protein FBZ83_103274 [Azospirillum brasilense]
MIDPSCPFSDTERVGEGLDLVRRHGEQCLRDRRRASGLCGGDLPNQALQGRCRAAVADGMVTLRVDQTSLMKIRQDFLEDERAAARFANDFLRTPCPVWITPQNQKDLQSPHRLDRMLKKDKGIVRKHAASPLSVPVPRGSRSSGKARRFEPYVWAECAQDVRRRPAPRPSLRGRIRPDSRHLSEYFRAHWVNWPAWPGAIRPIGVTRRKNRRADRFGNAEPAQS